MNVRRFLLCALLLSTPILMGANADDTPTPDSSSTNTPATKVNQSLISPYYPGTNTDTTSAEFSTIQGCPGDPVRINAAGSNWPTGPACANINGIYSTSANMIRYGSPTTPQVPIYIPVRDPITGAMMSGSGPNDVFCPNQCTVTQYATYDMSGRPTSVVRPICPDGYIASSGGYNIQPEIIFYATAQSLPFPVPDIATYNRYVYDLKYTCTLESTSSSVGSTCLRSISVPSTVSYTFSAPLNSLTVGTGASGQGVGIYSFSSSNCREWSDTCSGGTGSCDGWIICNDNTVGNQTTTRCQQPSSHDIWFSVNYNYSFRYYRCQIPAGYSYSTNVAPSSVMCVRQQQVWQKGN